jgi:hypothetical protein
LLCDTYQTQVQISEQKTSVDTEELRRTHC